MTPEGRDRVARRVASDASGTTGSSAGSHGDGCGGWCSALVGHVDGLHELLEVGATVPYAVERPAGGRLRAGGGPNPNSRSSIDGPVRRRHRDPADVGRLELGPARAWPTRANARPGVQREIRAASGAPMTSADSVGAGHPQRDPQVDVGADVVGDDAARALGREDEVHAEDCGRAGRRRPRPRRTPGPPWPASRTRRSRSAARGGGGVRARRSMSTGPSRRRRASRCSRRLSSALSEISARCVEVRVEVGDEADGVRQLDALLERGAALVVDEQEGQPGRRVASASEATSVCSSSDLPAPVVPPISACGPSARRSTCSGPSPVAPSGAPSVRCWSSSQRPDHVVGVVLVRAEQLEQRDPRRDAGAQAARARVADRREREGDLARVRARHPVDGDVLEHAAGARVGEDHAREVRVVLDRHAALARQVAHRRGRATARRCRAAGRAEQLARSGCVRARPARRARAARTGRGRAEPAAEALVPLRGGGAAARSRLRPAGGPRSGRPRAARPRAARRSGGRAASTSASRTPRPAPRARRPRSSARAGCAA